MSESEGGSVSEGESGSESEGVSERVSGEDVSEDESESESVRGVEVRVSVNQLTSHPRGQALWRGGQQE